MKIVMPPVSILGGEFYYREDGQSIRVNERGTIFGGAAGVPWATPVLEFRPETWRDGDGLRLPAGMRASG